MRGFGRPLTAKSGRWSDEPKLLKHPHLVPLLPAFGYLISDHMIKDQSNKLNLFSCCLCVAQWAIVCSSSYPPEGGFVISNHLIYDRNVEVRKCYQEAIDQLLER